MSNVNEYAPTIRERNGAVEVLLKWDLVREWTTGDEAIGNALTDSAWAWLQENPLWEIVDEEEGPEIFFEGGQGAEGLLIGVRFQVLPEEWRKPKEEPHV